MLAASEHVPHDCTDQALDQGKQIKERGKEKGPHNILAAAAELGVHVEDALPGRAVAGGDTVQGLTALVRPLVAALAA